MKKIKLILPPGGSGYVGTSGVVPSAGVDVEVSGLTVTGKVLFPPVKVHLFTLIKKTDALLLHNVSLF